MGSGLPGSLPSYIHFKLFSTCIFPWLIKIVVVVMSKQFNLGL